MKKLITLSFVLTSFLFTNAQAPSNATVYDCNGAVKNIYQSLASGKSVIVAHKGVDCSICRNSAPGWQTWAAANTNKVEVWGAITYTFNSSSFQPMCQKTLNWKSQYSWNDIFTFADSNRQWVGNSSPLYFVYSAIDSSIVYSGNNSTTARNMALAQSTVGLKTSILEGSIIYYSNNNIVLENLNDNIVNCIVFKLNGQVVKEVAIRDTNETISVSNLPKGTYLFNFRTTDNQISTKKLLIN